MTQQINLFDPALQRRRDWLALDSVVAAGVLLLTGVVVAGVLARNPLPALQARTATNEAQIKALREQMTALGQMATQRKPDVRLENELAEARQLAGLRGEVLQVLQQRVAAPADAFADHLRGFARQSIQGLWITGFAYDADSGAMEIRGRTIDPALLPTYIGRLNQEPAFQGRAFSALKLAEGKIEPPANKANKANEAAKAGIPSAKAPYHEFILIPRKTETAAPAGTVAGRQG